MIVASTMKRLCDGMATYCRQPNVPRGKKEKADDKDYDETVAESYRVCDFLLHN